MPRLPKIKTRSWVYVNGERVELSSLPPDKRRRVGLELAKTYYNALFSGEAVFSLPMDNK